MRNEIAEWVLSQAAPPEQAKAVLGDLLEAQPRSREFWVSVLRATASIARHQPRQVLWRLASFLGELGCYCGMGWAITQPRYPLFLLLVIGALWMAVATAMKFDERKNPSVLLPVLYFLWFFKHLGSSTASSIPFALVMGMPTVWALRRARKKQLPEGDPPVAQ